MQIDIDFARSTVNHAAFPNTAAQISEQQIQWRTVRFEGTGEVRPEVRYTLSRINGQLFGQPVCLDRDRDFCHGAGFIQYCEVGQRKF